MVNATNNKIIVLVPRANAKDVTGVVDKNLFTGKNKLHAVLEDNGLWSLHYDSGMMNEQLRQRFTSLSMALRTVKEYFNKRNIDIKEVIE